MTENDVLWLFPLGLVLTAAYWAARVLQRLGGRGLAHVAVLLAFTATYPLSAVAHLGPFAGVIPGFFPVRRTPAAVPAPVVTALAPVALWVPYLAAFALTGGIGWPPALWAGVVLLAALGGLALAQLMAPPTAVSPPDHR